MDRPDTGDDFLARARGYFLAVKEGNADLGVAFFFPRAAYLQVKTLQNAGGDYDQRIYHDYRNDVAADHQLLGADSDKATLLGIDVPTNRVRWVPPGVEANKVGYWQVSDARVRYEVDGQQRSFAISSMISWRGKWYIVHLGPNWRPGPGGWICTPEPPNVPRAAACLRG